MHLTLMRGSLKWERIAQWHLCAPGVRGSRQEDSFDRNPWRADFFAYKAFIQVPHMQGSIITQGTFMHESIAQGTPSYKDYFTEIRSVGIS